MSKKIIIFHHEFCVSGGAEHTLFEVMDYLTEAGFDYQCYTSIIDKNNCFPDQIRNYKIYSFFPYFKQVPRIIYPILMALLSPILLMRFSNASLFYGANQSGPFLAYIASLIHKKPYIIYMPYPLTLLYPRQIDKQFDGQTKKSLLTKIITSIIKPPLYFIDKQIINNASAVLSEGNYAVSLFKKIYNREIINAPAGAELISETEFKETNRFQGQINISNINISKPYILLTNRHVPKKKFEYAIKAMQIIKNLSDSNKTYMPILIITGAQNEYTQQLKQLAKELDVENHIYFVGLISEQQILQLYKNAAVYIYTAPEEDYGKGVIQAMATGTPSVVWDNAGPGKNIINNQTGFTVPLDDIQTYSQKIYDLINNYSLQQTISKKAYQYAKQNYSKQSHKKIIIDTVNLYHSN